MNRPVTGRDAFVEIEGEDYDGQSGATKEDSNDSATLGQSLGDRSGGYAFYNVVDFSDAGAAAVQLRVNAAERDDADAAHGHADRHGDRHVRDRRDQRCVGDADLQPDADDGRSHAVRVPGRRGPPQLPEVPAEPQHDRNRRRRRRHRWSRRHGRKHEHRHRRQYRHGPRGHERFGKRRRRQRRGRDDRQRRNRHRPGGHRGAGIDTGTAGTGGIDTGTAGTGGIDTGTAGTGVVTGAGGTTGGPGAGGYDGRVGWWRLRVWRRRRWRHVHGAPHPRPRRGGVRPPQAEGSPSLHDSCERSLAMFMTATRVALGLAARPGVPGRGLHEQIRKASAGRRPSAPPPRARAATGASTWPRTRPTAAPAAFPVPPQSCEAGVCRCPAGLVDCNGSCVPDTSPCGAAGTPVSLVTSAPGAYWKTDGQLTEVTSGNADVTVDDTAAAQTWEGFGGSFNEMGWKVLSLLSAGDRDRAINSSTASTARGSPSAGSRSGRATTRSIATRSTRPRRHDAGRFSIARDMEKLIPYIKAAQAIRPASASGPAPGRRPRG